MIQCFIESFKLHGASLHHPFVYLGPLESPKTPCFVSREPTSSDPLVDCVMLNTQVFGHILNGHPSFSAHYGCDPSYFFMDVFVGFDAEGKDEV
jgi:hypothetical protein